MVSVSIVFPLEIANLGHVSEISKLRISDSIGFSLDIQGYWSIWNLNTKVQLVSGNSDTGSVDFQNYTLINKVKGGIAVFKYPDFDNPQNIITDSASFNLSNDGKILWSSNKSCLRIWTTNGKKIIDTNGNFSNVLVNTDSINIYVSKSDSTCTFIGVYDILTGKFIKSIPFDGVFNRWSIDGKRFLTTQSTVVRIYSTNGIREEIRDIGTTGSLGAFGEYYWTYSDGNYPNYPLNLYKIGSQLIPFKTINNSVYTKIVTQCGIIGILPYGIDSFSVVRLLPDSISISKNKGSGPYLSAFAAGSSGRWLTGNKSGVVNCGFLNSSPQTMNYGRIRALAGTNDSIFAAATSSGKVLIYKLKNGSTMLLDTFTHNSSGLQFSSDGKVLASQGNTTDQQYSPDDLSLLIFNVPAHSLSKKFTHNYFNDPNSDYLRDFDLSRDGKYISQLTSTWDGSVLIYRNSIIKIANDSTVFQDNISSIAPRLSPANQFIATFSNNLTKIFKNPNLEDSFTGNFLCWLTDDKIVSSDNLKTIIRSIGGKIDATYSTLPPVQNAILVTDSEIYDRDKKLITNIKTGKRLFQLHAEADVSVPVGTDYLIYTDGVRLLAADWRQASSITYKNNKRTQQDNTLVIKYSSGILKFNVTLNQPDSYSLHIYEINGRLLRQYDSGNLKQGFNSFMLNIQDNCKTLQSRTLVISVKNTKGIVSNSLIQIL
jgi:hypothetical protein